MCIIAGWLSFAEKEVLCLTYGGAVGKAMATFDAPTDSLPDPDPE